MSDHAAFVETLREAWTRPTLQEALDMVRPTFRADAMLSQPLVRTRRGFDGFEAHIHGLARIVPDLRLRVTGSEVDGDEVSIFFEMTGTVGRRSLHVRTRDDFVMVDGRVAGRRVHMNGWALVRPILMTPRVWPRAIGVFVRSWL